MGKSNKPLNNKQYTNELTNKELEAPEIIIPEEEPEEVDPSKPNTIPKFVDKLPIPGVLTPDEKGEGYAYYDIVMRRARHRFHRDFPLTEIWGYNGTYPGPTIEAYKGQTVFVKWQNKLPCKHLLPVDKTIHGAINNPEVRTVVHLHGAEVAPDSDGHPEAWYTRDYITTGSKFSRKVYRYLNDQQATTLWYHDHALGITRLNVYAGLAGFYIIHDDLEERLNIPKGEYDIPLLIQDKSFNPDGSLFYPAEPANPVEGVYPSIVPAFIGNTIVVNGKLWPYHEVEPRKYRFRILNGSNTSGFTFKLSNGQSFWQIGTDGGLLQEPVEINSFMLEPAERIDLIIDFSQLEGETVTLMTDNEDPNTSNVMQFKVVLPLKKEDTTEIPKTLNHFMELNPTLAKQTRRVSLDTATDSHGRPLLLLNNLMWDDPATETPEYDSIEIWEIVNPTQFAHPIHLHLVQFQILDRRPFDVDYYRRTGRIRYFINRRAEEPLPFERGWKDVVRAEAGKVTRIIAHFKNFYGDYVWHCHILEHEDFDMMRPLRVIKKYV
ncbi:MAG: multicopper oxidase domain-containing protein [Clostridiales bacterium]|nr:multicopper oxidase domain-containing protein [Clostridiales bacterium]